MEYLKSRVGLMFTFLIKKTKMGELIDWQFDWGGRL